MTGKDTPAREDRLGAKEVTLRRVYALPAEMVDRITDFQKEKGFGSEVEAVRRLIDEALKHRDSVDDVINRVLARLKGLKLVSEAAKDVLVGHPLVAAMKFAQNKVTFETRDNTHVSIDDDGHVTIIEIDGREERLNYWYHPKGDRLGRGYSARFEPGEPGDYQTDMPF